MEQRQREFKGDLQSAHPGTGDKVETSDDPALAKRGTLSGMADRPWFTTVPLAGTWSWIPLAWVLLVAIATAADSDKRLIDAVRNQDRNLARTLIAAHVDVNASQADGATALHWAMHWGDIESARLLIQGGARVNATNDYGVTPLILACGNGGAAGVRMLLEAGADPDKALPTGETPLMTASRSGKRAAVQALLEYGADVSAKEGAQEQTALMWAAAERHARVVQLLLDYGADARARSTSGLTALLLSARQGDLESARLLLAAGADVNGAAADRLSPLLVATVRDHSRLAVFLLDHGADPNAEGPGFTPLHWAAGLWETELTGPRGIDTVRDEEWRALRGISEGKLELITALLEHGANPNAAIVKPPQRVGFTRGGLNLVGATPFVVAAGAADAALMRLLVAHGADPQLSTRENTTPLMAAAGVGRVAAESSVSEARAFEAVTLALELGGEVNASNNAGDTALHGAASMRSDRIVQFLVERGAQVNVKNKRGQTPLSNARGSSTADLLRKLGAETADAK
jgi:ankyrin repeat protein